MRNTDSISSMGYVRVDQLPLLSKEFILNEVNYVDMPRGLDYWHCYSLHCTLKIIRAIKGSPKRPIIRTLK